MLDARPEATRRGAPGRLDRGAYLFLRAVPVRVDGKLEPGRTRPLQRLDDVGRRQRKSSRPTGASRVVALDRGARRRVAAVGEQLYPLDGEERLGRARSEDVAPAARLFERHRARRPQVDADASAELARRVESVHVTQPLDRLRDLADARDTVPGEGVAKPASDRLEERGLVHARERQEVVHLLDNPRRLAAVTLDDRAACDAVLRRSEGPVDAGQLERARVEHRDVASGSQGDRDIRAHLVELGAGRQPPVGELLVEEEVALPDEPAAIDAVEVLAQDVEDVGDRLAGRRPAVDRGGRRARGDLGVGVDVDEAGHDRPLARVDDLRLRRRQLGEQRPRPGGDDAPSGDRNDLGLPLRAAAHCQDAAGDHDELSRAVRVSGPHPAIDRRLRRLRGAGSGVQPRSPSAERTESGQRARPDPTGRRAGGPSR